MYRKDRPTYFCDLEVAMLLRRSTRSLAFALKHLILVDPLGNIGNRRNTRVADKVDPEYGVLASQPHSPGA